MRQAEDKWVLSLDGGGIRGMISAVFLQKLEEALGRPVGECFDLVAGTSSGSVLAAGLSIGPDGKQVAPTADLPDFFAKEAPRLFRRSPIPFATKLKWLFGPIYDIDALRGAITRQVGDLRLSQLRSHTLLTAYDMRMARPVLFQSWLAGGADSPAAAARAAGRGAMAFCPTREARDPQDFGLSEAVAASSAVPTFFAPVRAPRGESEHFALIDGFVFALNPVLPAYFAARQLFGAHYNIRILSIGTGKAEKSFAWQELRGRGALGWVRPILDAFPDATSDASELYMDWMTEIADIEHTRVTVTFDAEADPDRPSLAFDDASPKNIARLRLAGERLFDDHADRLSKLHDDLRGHTPERVAAERGHAA